MKINKNLLKDLYMIDHPSGSEHTMMSYILNYCKSIPNIIFELDHYNNLFITKNTNNPETYPCLIAHTDQISTNKGPFRIVETGDLIYGVHKSDGSRCGLGCDDSNGICIALQLLETLPDLKCIFTTEEELGARGAIEACFNTDFLFDVKYFLQADRRGSSDLITHTNCIDVVTPEFLEDLEPIMNKYKYSKNSGTFTDVGEIVAKTGICGVNISCGYYKEHTCNEYCNIKELENCLNFIYDIITTLSSNEPYNIKINYYKFDYDYYWEYKGNFDVDFPSENNDFKDINESLPCDTCRHMDCMHCNFVNDY